ncbi:MAG: Crp/Fnr family transcriptional regulator [Alphaproteobacteria bacterium]|nr:Crp/Fnr family transcriptional regulator [Alphaproteobacteria bacterium]MDD9919064.1 Crp/Fnr family transcriptional regulator [Alphaproteobacteria bacterium]
MMTTIPTSIRQRFNELQHVKLFEGMDIGALTPLLSAARIQKYHESKIILRQDDPPTHLCIILEGQARIYRMHEDGREAVTRILSKGHTMFENVIFFDEFSPVNGEIIKHAELMMIPARLVQKFAADNATFAVNVAKVLAERTNQMMFQQELISLHSAKDRLGAFFLSAMLEQKKFGQNFKLDFEKALVARHLAMTPETLSRTLKELKNLGINVNGNSITLEKPCTLCQFYDGMIARKCDKARTDACPHHHRKYLNN